MVNGTPVRNAAHNYRDLCRTQQPQPSANIQNSPNALTAPAGRSMQEFGMTEGERRPDRDFDEAEREVRQERRAILAVLIVAAIAVSVFFWQRSRSSGEAEQFAPAATEVVR